MKWPTINRLYVTPSMFAKLSVTPILCKILQINLAGASRKVSKYGVFSGPYLDTFTHSAVSYNINIHYLLTSKQTAAELHSESCQ